MSELKDFVGDLNRSSEGVLEGGSQKDSPSPPPPAAAMEEEEEEEEVLSVGEDCDAMEGVEQGGGGGGGFEDSGVAEQQQCRDAAGEGSFLLFQPWGWVVAVQGRMVPRLAVYRAPSTPQSFACLHAYLLRVLQNRCCCITPLLLLLCYSS